MALKESAHIIYDFNNERVGDGEEYPRQGEPPSIKTQR